VSPLRFGRTRRSPEASRGQVLIIFAGALLAIIGLCAIVIDIAWYWSMNLRIQRAADAAALAGVIFLPGSPTQADVAAKAEAAKNGYTDHANGVAITTLPDPLNDRRLKVIINAPVGTFFSRVLGIDSFPARREAKADYVQPVPMGSPDQYYGVGYWVKPETTTTTSTNTDTADTDWQTAKQADGDWSASGGGVDNALRGNDDQHAVDRANLGQEVITTFGLAGNGNGNGNGHWIPVPNADQTLAIKGIEVRLTDAHISASCSGSRIGVELSWVGSGNAWTTRLETPVLGTDAAAGDYTLGSATGVGAWGAHAWTRPEFLDTAFRLRLTGLKGCTTPSTEIRLDAVEVRVTWDLTTTTTTTTTHLIQDAPVPAPPGQPAITRPQHFWGAMQSQGAPNVQGDAFLAKFETRRPGGGGGTLQRVDPTQDPDARYDPDHFYDYAIEIPSGVGSVWIFDPGFCDGSGDGGTGERWNVSGSTDGNPTGNPTRKPVSAFFDLYDTHGTLLDDADDSFIVGTGNAFRRQAYQDHAVLHELDRQHDGNADNEFDYSQPDCTAQPGHFGWYQLATGLRPGTYRLHSYSTDTAALNDQDDSTGVNAFAFYAGSTSGAPRIYGLGTMEAYVRLPGGQRTAFYLARIDAVHAGKTMRINLWDAGDTNQLSASLHILKPTGSGFGRATFDWTAWRGTTNPSASDCDGLGAKGVDTIVTNTGNNSRFNGCWISIELQLPADYTAPVDPVSGERGWWKIEYEMGGQPDQFSTDLTTWNIQMRGNPVHLVIP
jgi:hypothetical protein